MDTLSKISALLKQKNKTQKDLTDFLGVHSNNFTNWKLGKNTSYLKYISQIAEYLDVSTDYLLGTEQKEKSLSEKDKLIDEVSNMLKSMSDSQIIAFRDMLKSFAQSKGK